jgi:CheY-like chemotaxis protein
LVPGGRKWLSAEAGIEGALIAGAPLKPFLQGIIGSLDRVQFRIAQGRISDVDRFLKGAIASANRAAALTHRLLAFSRRQPVDPKPVNANELIGSIEELLRRSLGEAVTLKTDLSSDLNLIRCDTNQLENALLNLVINARDAMPGGGDVTIATANKILNEKDSLKYDLPAGNYVSIQVRDNGVGMPADVKSRAFDPFFTTKPIGQGTGLGLSMIYGFVRQSDGSVRIDSEIDKGTAIEICLPQYNGVASPEAPDSVATEGFGTDHGEIILVVEDEAVVRLLVVETLQDLGYRALEAAEGQAALRILQSGQRVDLPVTDIGLPGLNGRQLADAGRITRPNLKILFMTGYAETAASSNFLTPGMEIIAKPFEMDVLAKRVRHMLESGTA